MPLYLGSCGVWDGFKPNNKSFRLVVFIFATFCKDGVFKDGVLTGSTIILNEKFEKLNGSFCANRFLIIVSMVLLFSCVASFFFRLVVFIFATFCKDCVFKDCVLKVGYSGS